MEEAKRRSSDLNSMTDLMHFDMLNFTPSYAGSNQFLAKGVPQGLPISPLLSTLFLERTILINQDAVMYADDGIIFCKNPIKLENDFTP